MRYDNSLLKPTFTGDWELVTAVASSGMGDKHKREIIKRLIG